MGKLTYCMTFNCNMHVCFITLSSHPFRVEYHISIDTNNNNLTIELEQIDTNEKWNAVFPSKCKEFRLLLISSVFELN